LGTDLDQASRIVTVAQVTTPTAKGAFNISICGKRWVRISIWSVTLMGYVLTNTDFKPLKHEFQPKIT
jgi:hypothetical protein